MLPQRNSLLGNNRLLYPLSSAKVDIFFHPSTITSAFNHGSSLKESKQVSEEELTQTTDRPEQKRGISKVRSIPPPFIWAAGYHFVPKLRFRFVNTLSILNERYIPPEWNLYTFQLKLIYLFRLTLWRVRARIYLSLWYDSGELRICLHFLLLISHITAPFSLLFRMVLCVHSSPFHYPDNNRQRTSYPLGSTLLLWE